MQKKIILNNEIINYFEEESNKEPILFIHGYNSSWKFVYPLINLERNYKIIALDLPGHGLSTFNEKISIESISKIVNEFIIKLDLKNIIVVGHSLGGAITAKISISNKIKKSLLIAPFNFEIHNEISKKIKKWLSPSSLDEAKDSVLNLVKNVSKNVYFKNIDATSLAFFKQTIRTRERFKYLLNKQILNKGYSNKLRTYYENSSNKLEIISGDKDLFIEINSLKEVSKKLSIPLIVIKGCGHATIYEKPIEINNKINFLILQKYIIYK